MVPLSDLKVWLHKPELRKVDKLLVILASFPGPSSLEELRKKANEAGYRITTSSNPSAMLASTGGKAIRTPQGWELTPSGIKHVQSLGISFGESAPDEIADDLRKEANRISDLDTKAFLEEAIACYEHKLNRSAIVMSWLTAIQVLRQYVHANALNDFNKEASRVNPKWKTARTTDDIGRMDESEFLDRLVAISVIGKNVKDELQECLKRRNGCGHPNSLKVRRNTVKHHIEILIVNVLQKFA
ncbi:MAG TPA: hypothetical protein VIM56_12170 [Rhizomicrobium sp.]